MSALVSLGISMAIIGALLLFGVVFVILAVGCALGSEPEVVSAWREGLEVENE